MELLSSERIQELHAAAVKLRVHRPALLSGMDEKFVASLPDTPDLASQLLSDLKRLNRTGPLADGSIPLKVWLENAATLADSRLEGEVFRSALASISSGERSPAPAPEPPLPWWRRAVFRASVTGLSVIALGAAVTAAVMSYQHPPIPPPASSSLSASSAPPAPAPLIERFPRGAVGVVVMAPPEIAALAEALCGKLQHTGARGVACVARTNMEEEATLAQAKEAGAALFVGLRSDKTASIVPLGAPELAPLLQGMPRFDASQETFAPSIYVLAVLAASGEPDLDPKECPQLDQGPIERLSLLVSLFAPACFPVTMEPARLLSICEQKDAESDGSCALARLLYVERWPVNPDVERVLEKLRDHSPGPFRTEAAVKLALLHCEKGEETQAVRELSPLASTPDDCVRITLSGIAACVMAKPKGKVPADVVSLEALPIGQQNGCRPRTQAMSLGQRAFWRGRGGRWKEAEADYQAAYERFKDPKYALGQAEARLHQKRPAEALTLLQSLQGVRINDRSDDIYRGLLRWIAARDGDASTDLQEAEAASLVELYRTLPDGAQGFDEPDPDLRSLCCRGGRGASCPYDGLMAPKSGASVDALRRGLSVRR